MFKKIGEFFKKLFEGIGGDVAVDQVSNLIENGLEKFYASDPQNATALVQSFYAFTPTLTELAKKTSTSIDDKLAKELVEDIAKFAALKGIDLPSMPVPSGTQTDDGGPGSNPEEDDDH